LAVFGQTESKDLRLFFAADAKNFGDKRLGLLMKNHPAQSTKGSVVFVNEAGVFRVYEVTFR
jgi:hypothetical protein